MKILVIDDDPDIVEAVSLTFEMRWPESNVASAPDGDPALFGCADHHVNLSGQGS